MVRVSAVAALTVTRAESPVPMLPTDVRDTVGAVMVPDDVMLPVVVNERTPVADAVRLVLAAVERA